jgi:hypothetical protein
MEGAGKEETRPGEEETGRGYEGTRPGEDWGDGLLVPLLEGTARPVKKNLVAELTLF